MPAAERPPAWSRSWSDCATPLAELPAVVVDLETTGLRAWGGDRVIEIGVVPVDGRGVREHDAWSQLVDPGRPSTEPSREVHGIDDAELVGQPPLSAVLPELQAQLAGRALVGQNVGFDVGFLRAEMQRLGRAVPLQTSLDTVLLARAAIPDELDGYGLDRLVARLGVPDDGLVRHRALPDALLTARVYVRLLERLADAGVETLYDLQRVCAEATLDSERGRRRLARGVVEALLSAMASSAPLAITYASPVRAPRRGSPPVVETRRTVEPIALRGLWLDALCHLRGELRTFRLDRIIDFDES